MDGYGEGWCSSTIAGQASSVAAGQGDRRHFAIADSVTGRSKRLQLEQKILSVQAEFETEICQSYNTA